MDEYKLYREPRTDAPNRLARLIEVATAVIFVLIVVYLLHPS
jgi:hypothetical protein